MPQDEIAVAVGSSGRTDATRAGKEAAQRASAGLSPLSPQFALVFGSSWFHQQQLLQGVHAVLRDVPLVGGSTAGEILADGPVSHSCVVVLLAGESLHCSMGIGKEMHLAPRRAGYQAAQTAVRGFQSGTRAGFLLFGDGLSTGSEEVMRGLREVLGTSSLIAGGMMGDDERFSQTYQYFNNRVVNHAVVGVLLGGSVKIGIGIEHGFAPISKPRRISRARGEILFELDKHPAASVYEEYVGSDVVRHMREEGVARQGSLYPLGISSGASGQWLLRTIVSLEPDGSLRCNGEIPEGGWLQLMISNKQLAMDAAHRAAQQAIQLLNQVALILVFDSIVRRQLLGRQDAASEVERIRQAVGPSIPLAGCYTYGEQGSLGHTSVYGGAAVQTGSQTSSVLVVALGT